jgi:hypothetical protein
LIKDSSKNRDEAWMQERKRELDALIELSNAEIQSMETRDIADLVYGCRLFEEDEGWQSFIIKRTSAGPDPQDLAIRKRSLLELQSHLMEKLKKILSAVKTGDQTPILEISGTTVFSAHPAKDRFLLNLKEGEEVDSLKKQKARLDLRMLDLVRILGLKPRRFKECPQCKHFFYQPGSKEKVYCSQKCSGAHRQKEFQKKIKKGGGA